jgi:hypothetical protein
MSKQYSGALITKTPVTPTSLSASGIWSLSDQAEAQATNTWPFPRDPQFNYVTMLLHGDGSAGVPSTGSGAGASTTVTNFNADASTNNFNVTINGDARSNNFNPYQSGYYSNYFDGTGDYLTIAGTSTACALPGDFTIECFYFQLATVNYGSIFSTVISYATANGLRISTGNNTNTFEVASSGAIISASNAFTPNSWIHIALVRSGTTLTLYQNGVSVGSATNSTSFVSDTFIIGDVQGVGAPYALNGYISNFRVVKGTAVYTAAFTPPTSPLTAITNTSLLTCQSNRFIDNSTNAFTITVNGNTAVSPAIPFTLPSSVATYGSGYLDGSGDYLSVSDNTAFDFAGDFTVEGYFYFVQINQVATATVLFSTNVLDRFQLATESNIISLRINGTLIFNASYTSANLLNVWTHIAVVRTGSTVAIFVNGTRITTGTSSATCDNSVFYIGIQTPGYSNHYFNGYMSSVRVVNGSGPYNATVTTLTVPTAPLTAVTNTSLLTTQYNGGGNNSGFKDSSQFNFPITRNGNTTQGTFTPYSADWSNNLNGSSGVTVSSTSAQFSFAGDFTWEAWINPSALPSSGNVVSIICSRGSVASNSAFQFLFGNTSGTYRIETTISIGGSDSGLNWNIPTTPTVGTWYHVAVVRSGSSVQAYWNGAAIGSAQTASGTTNTPTVSPSIGFRGGSYNDLFFNGYISNFRMVGSAVYTSAFTPSITPLTAISGTRLLTCQSNRFIDNSTNAFTLTAYSSPSVQGFSPFAPLTVYNPATYGGSLYGDGTGDYLSIPYSASNSLNAGDFTVEAWVYKNSNAAYMAVGGTMTSAAPYNTKWQIIGDSGGTKITWCSDAFLITSSATLYTGTWYHVAFVRSSGTLRLYINGVLDSSAADTRNYNSATDLWVAQVPENVSGRNWNGYITNFRINPTTAVYTANFTPNTTPLTATSGTSFLLATTNAGILDNAMMNNLETVGNAAVSTSVKKYGAASMYFDGTDDRLNMPSSPNLAFGTGDFTLEMWAYFTSVASFPTLTDSRSSTGSTAGFNLGLSTAKVQLYTTSQLLIGSSTLSTNTWYHIAVTRASGTLKIWLNGVQDATVSNSTNWSDQTFIVGATPTPTNYMTGYIDDLRITKGVARYTATFTVPDQAFPNG